MFIFLYVLRLVSRTWKSKGCLFYVAAFNETVRKDEDAATTRRTRIWKMSACEFLAYDQLRIKYQHLFFPTREVWKYFKSFREASSHCWWHPNERRKYGAREKNNKLHTKIVGSCPNKINKILVASPYAEHSHYYLFRIIYDGIGTRSTPRDSLLLLWNNLWIYTNFRLALAMRGWSRGNDDGFARA